MTLDEIRELINLVTETGVAELEVQRGEDRVRIRRAFPVNSQEIVIPVQAAASAPLPSPAASAHPPVASAAAPAPGQDVLSDPSLLIVKSPIVGTFYEAASPGAPPFVRVGDRVQPGQVLCIIESMKLMNEIEAETAGVIMSKLITNAQPVEYGEGLFAIRPV
jgi:acetyl-CoA carboxylase biotin carboxyl carrier protein